MGDKSAYPSGMSYFLNFDHLINDFLCLCPHRQAHQWNNNEILGFQHSASYFDTGVNTLTINVYFGNIEEKLLDSHTFFQ